VSGESLYRRLLGPDFDRLPEALRRFHGAADGGVGAGVVDVRVGARPWTRMLARVLGLPPGGDRVPVTVRVRRVGDREIWDRAFGASRLRSVQWLEHGRLRERVGVLTFAFDVSADERGMRFRFVELTVFGIRVPPRLSLHVDADATAGGGDWHVSVAVRTPRRRLITSYQGRIVPSPAT